MLIVEPTVTYCAGGDNALIKLESYGRTCYKSVTDELDPNSAEKFVRMLIANGHDSVLEHESVTMRICCDRGITHEIVRHRIGSYSQESTRYCCYNDDRFNNQISVIRPIKLDTAGALDPTVFTVWYKAMEQAEDAYMKLVHLGVPTETARSVLPTCVKSEIVVTYNLREWRHFIKLRTARSSHPDMRVIANKCLAILKAKIPVVFDDL